MINLTTDRITLLKSKSLGGLSLIVSLLLFVISGVALFSPESVSQGELPPIQLFRICLIAGLTIFIGGLLAFKRKLSLGYILFFMSFFIGCTFAIMTKQQSEQFQNSIVALAITVFVATYFSKNKYTSHNCCPLTWLD